MKSINKEYTDYLQNMKLDVTFSGGKYTIVDKVAQEGLLLTCDDDGYRVETFAFINGEQVIGEASSDNVFDALNYLEDVLIIGVPAPIPDKHEVATLPEMVDVLNMVNDKITKQNLELRTNAIETLLMMQTTDKTYIKIRPGPKKTTLSYVDGTYMTRALNFAFLFDWSFEVPETRQDGDFFTALGVLTANLDGKQVVKSQWGSQKMRAGMELGDALKGATTDALKKCASMFGIAADVYAGEV